MSRGTGFVGLRESARRYCVTRSSASLLVEVADQHQRRVVRDVIGPEELADVRDRGRLEILHAPDRRVLVGMDRERLVVDDLVQPPVRLILDAHPALFLDHLLSVLKTASSMRRVARRSASSQSTSGRYCAGKGLPEDRRVLVRVGVALPADARDPRWVPFGLHVLRALEHHVFEQVRETGPPGLLVLGSDVVPDFRLHDRRRVVLEHHHLEPVGQCGHRVIEFRRAVRRTGAGIDDEDCEKCAGHAQRAPNQFSHGISIMTRGDRLSPCAGIGGVIESTRPTRRPGRRRVTPNLPVGPTPPRARRAGARGRRWFCGAPGVSGTPRTPSASRGCRSPDSRR